MTTPRIGEIAKALTQKILLEPNFVVEEMLTQALAEAHQAGIRETKEKYDFLIRQTEGGGYVCYSPKHLPNIQPIFAETPELALKYYQEALKDSK